MPAVTSVRECRWIIIHNEIDNRGRQNCHPLVAEHNAADVTSVADTRSSRTPLYYTLLYTIQAPITALHYKFSSKCVNVKRSSYIAYQYILKCWAVQCLECSRYSIINVPAFRSVICHSDEKYDKKVEKNTARWSDRWMMLSGNVRHTNQT